MMTLIAADHLLAMNTRDSGAVCVFDRAPWSANPQVISGPASSGQQVCTGERARSTSNPSTTCSWHGGRLTFWCHIQDFFENRQLLQGVAIPWAAPAPSKGQQAPNVAQCLHIIRAHP